MSYTTDDLRGLLCSLRDKKIIAFCGAGISVLSPSNAPSWWEIYVQVAQSLKDRFHEGFPDYPDEIDLDQLLSPYATQELSDLVISSFAGESFLDELKVVDIADSNENHVCLTSLALAGQLRGIVTTNWDTLLERTAAVQERHFTVVSPGKITKPSAESLGMLVKIHGTVVDPDGIKESFSHKSKTISPLLQKSWRELLDEDVELLVLGFSGADVAMGTVKAFFEDFSKYGKKIWWLHRKNSPPKLPEIYLERIQLFEGDLPFFLRDIVYIQGLSQFTTPVNNRDSQLELRRSIDEWSKSLHIGRWSACRFFLLLLSQKKLSGHLSDNGLYQYLLSLADDLSAFEPGKKVDFLDSTARTIYLKEAGLQCMRNMEIERAVQTFYTNLQLLSNFHKLVAKDKSSRSYSESRSNLSGAWNNYAAALLLSKKSTEAMNAYENAFHMAYLARNVNAFLVALTNILEKREGFTRQRQSMVLLERMIVLADHSGSVQNAIEARLLLGFFHFCRNEAWLAADIARQTRQLATAAGLVHLQLAGGLLLGAALIKQGAHKVGLEMIAEIGPQFGSAGFLSLVVLEIGVFINRLLKRADGPMMPQVDRDKIPEYLHLIKKELDVLMQGDLPWNGELVALQQSAVVDEADGLVLFNTGLADLSNDDVNRAPYLGIKQAIALLNQQQYRDAYWYVANLQLRPDLSAELRAYCFVISGLALAELGELERAAVDLEIALAAIKETKVAIQPDFIMSGLWFFVQDGDVDSASQWAEAYLVQLEDESLDWNRLYTLFSMVQSHGAWLHPVASLLHKRLSTHMHLEPLVYPEVHTAVPYIRFAAVVQKTKPSTQLLEDFAGIEQAFKLGKDPKETCEMISQFYNTHSPGAIQHLLPELKWVEVKSLSQLHGVEVIDDLFDPFRGSQLVNLDFGNLALSESNLISYALEANEREMVDRNIGYQFIMNFVDSPFLRLNVSKQFTDAALYLGGKNASEADYSFVRLARFYGLLPRPVGGLKNVENNMKSTDESTAVVSPSEIRSRCLEKLESCQDSEMIKDAIRLIREEVAHAEADTGGSIYGDVAKWLLDHGLYEEAIEFFEDARAIFEASGNQQSYINSIAGMARANSRLGKYEEAVTLFKQALLEANGIIKSNLLTGLGSAHLIEGAERRVPKDDGLMLEAMRCYQEAITEAESGSIEKAFAHLCLARCKGELGEQDKALALFDFAVAEMAHVAHPSAKILLENRALFEQGNWFYLSLH